MPIFHINYVKKCVIYIWFDIANYNIKMLHFYVVININGNLEEINKVDYIYRYLMVMVLIIIWNFRVVTRYIVNNPVSYFQEWLFQIFGKRNHQGRVIL